MSRDPLTHQHEITVLVTCYNEAEFIVQTLETVVAALDAAGRDYEILLVDDCSRDASAETIRGYLAEHPVQNIRYTPNETNRGLACNFIEGAHLGTGKYYRLCCGDNPETLEALTHIFQHVGVADMVIPYQVQTDVQGKSRLRKGISKLFTAIVNLLSGNNIRYYNALPVFMRYHVLRYPPQSYGFGFQADIVTRLLEENISFAQIRHLGAIDRKGNGSTALSMRNLLSVIHTFAEIIFRRLRRVIYGKGMPRAREIRIED